ncbi:hypothetical protein BDR22DRAFT_891363 [Usnea florida]
MTEVATSSQAMTLERIQPQNDFIAANLAAAFPTTPGRPTPNSAKKRRPIPHLTRPAATPGHRAKMSVIFRDAAISLQGSQSPTCRLSSNTKRFRNPLSQARSIHIDNPCQKDMMNSSGFGSPCKISRCSESSPKSTRASVVGRHQASGGGQRHPTPTPLPKLNGATFMTFTGHSRDVDPNFDAVCSADLLKVNSASSSSQIDEESKEPISSGFETPIAPTPGFIESPKDVKYPVLENWRSLRSSFHASCLGSDDEDLHSTHGVPLILPCHPPSVEEAQRSHIDTWLNEVVEATTFGLSNPPTEFDGTEDLVMNDAPPQSIAPEARSPTQSQASLSSLRHKLQSDSRASSDKENVSPSKNSSSHTRPSVPHLQTSSLFKSCQNKPHPVLQVTKAPRFAPPVTPQANFRVPPRRKRARVDKIDSSREENELLSPRTNFTIREDQLTGALVQLSPDVERHRKGRGPKRERCMSYWDEDIIPPASPCVAMDVGNNSKMPGKTR